MSSNKNQIRGSWKDKVLTKGSKDQDKEQQREQGDNHVADVQNAANEVREMLEAVLNVTLGIPSTVRSSPGWVSSTIKKHKPSPPK